MADDRGPGSCVLDRSELMEEFVREAVEEGSYSCPDGR